MQLDVCSTVSETYLKVALFDRRGNMGNGDDTSDGD